MSFCPRTGKSTDTSVQRVGLQSQARRLTMADNLLGRIGDLLRRRPWYELPRLLAVPRLIEMRNRLREKNLHDTEEPPFVEEAIPVDLDPRLKEERTLDGTFNDLRYPRMGC